MNSNALHFKRNTYEKAKLNFLEICAEFDEIFWNSFQWTWVINYQSAYKAFC